MTKRIERIHKKLWDNIIPVMVIAGGKYQRMRCPFCDIQKPKWGNHHNECKSSLALAKSIATECLSGSPSGR